MRVSEFYKIGKHQSSLPFLDVDIVNDTKLFLNVRAIRSLNSEFGRHCDQLVNDFFSHFLNLIKNDKSAEALKLLKHLREPNETHLGLSRGKSKGHGLGPEKAKEIWHSFCNSSAVKTGLLKDLEDTVLLIDGISVDILSDIVTNIIRGPLIGYTQSICREFNIPMAKEVASGPVWNTLTKYWDEDFVELPAPKHEKLILVPKAIVRINSDYSVSEYYRHYILERLKEEEKDANSELVHILKTGKNKGQPVVYKNEVQAKYGTAEKEVSIKQTEIFPELLMEYKNANSAPTPALSHRQIADALNVSMPDWDALIENVTSLEPGKKAAYDYEDSIAELLTTLFYPALVDPQTQTPINHGQKRVDLTFTNYARTGFFEWLSRNYNAPYVFVECKNFGEELGNPEIDQIAMRFAEDRGKFGIVVCRNIDDKPALLDRCRAIAKDRKEYILVLEDSDLVEMVDEARKLFPQDNEFKLLREKFKKLVF